MINVTDGTDIDVIHATTSDTAAEGNDSPITGAAPEDRRHDVGCDRDGREQDHRPD